MQANTINSASSLCHYCGVVLIKVTSLWFDSQHCNCSIFCLLQLPPEERVKRKQRRERNKLAAAKCRQRRVDHTNALVQVH